jgi:hypothetical protein
MAKKDPEKFADRTLMSWQRKLLDMRDGYNIEGVKQ